MKSLICIIFTRFRYTLTQPTFFTPNRHGYSVKFSPHDADRLAVATSQFFGLEGGGTLFFLELSEDGKTAVEFQKAEWRDGLFDVVWSPKDSSIVATCSGDGSIQLWKSGCLTALKALHEHKREVTSLDWCSSNQLISSSWDCCVKMWDPTRSKSLATFRHHSQLVYKSIQSPHSQDTAASVSGDGTLAVWCCKDEGKILRCKAHPNAEVLSCDWSKYNSNLICTSGSDGFIKGWDIRNINLPILRLRGSKSAVRRVQFSPHLSEIIATVSFDHTTRIWNWKSLQNPLETIRHHSEFTFGLDWNRKRRNQIADCGWDSIVHIFKPKCLKEYEKYENN